MDVAMNNRSDEREPTWKQWHDEAIPVRLGVSACLLGGEVRFDGGHKRDRYLTDILGHRPLTVTLRISNPPRR